MNSCLLEEMGRTTKNYYKWNKPDSYKEVQSTSPHVGKFKKYLAECRMAVDRS